MLLDLPLEIQMKLLYMVPHSNLKYTNSHFYILYNDLFYHKIVNSFGEDTLAVIVKVLPCRLELVDSLNEAATEEEEEEDDDDDRGRAGGDDGERAAGGDGGGIDQNPLNTQYIKDSWKYIYSIFKNKRLFAEYSDYKIDEPSNYVYNHFVEINRTYLLSYTKHVWLAPGTYNLNLGLAIKYGNGLGTTKFEVKYNVDNEENFSAEAESFDSSSVNVKSFYPPTNINEILPKNQFCFLKIGQFVVPPRKQVIKQRGGGNVKESRNNKLRKIEIKMEEIGLYLKSGFRIYFIDISQPSLLHDEFDLLYYTINETNYKLFINILLKNLYKAINYVQNGGCSDNASVSCAPSAYGTGDPYQIWNQYDKSFLKEYTSSSVPNSSSNSSSSISSLQSSILPHRHSIFKYDLKKLENYAKVFFAATKDLRRYFKFSTIYQQRQFINRFGDYQLDWEEENVQTSDKLGGVRGDHDDHDDNERDEEEKENKEAIESGKKLIEEEEDNEDNDGIGNAEKKRKRSKIVEQNLVAATDTYSLCLIVEQNLVAATDTYSLCLIVEQNLVAATDTYSLCLIVEQNLVAATDTYSLCLIVEQNLVAATDTYSLCLIVEQNLVAATDTYLVCFSPSEAFKTRQK
ncbi:hypothetical protein KGF56_004130 [Candida oxycetoniae]|uniref:Uncharacterized protein n=1 Tax=Candida oxycetoniae TaxID=497107 RepID=A0AAI9WWC3_9ASCO|nr:uncharacterized protein KGF56_004130 [Candida oxycetoniae]KAI3403070.2 hypothetical protein KGF56_004130 [Candida oxycetoniae]